MNQQTRAGFVALVGRPNVGKSTLINLLVGEKISIISKKPQTTRHRIWGVCTEGNNQIIFVDTPGLHRKHKYQLNRYMNRVALHSIDDVDAIVFMVEALTWKEDDDWILSILEKATVPVILLINKVDEVKDKSLLLPFVENLTKKMNFHQVFLISALKGDDLTAFKNCLIQLLPESPFLFPEDQITDKNESFLVAEIIREKLFRFLGQELPYNTTVTIDQIKREDKIIRVAATIWVEREGQKKIVIGEGGEKLKKIATQARLELENFFTRKVFLQTWVKVKSGWMDDEKLLHRFGYEE